MEAKNKYVSPHIEVVELDTEISLILSSSPPEGPEETAQYNPVVNSNSMLC
jgi:hypothetical protein